MGEIFNHALKRINAIDWDKIGISVKASNGMLVREYLRRATLFIHSLSLKSNYPFFSAAEAIGKKPQINIIKSCSVLEILDNKLLRGWCECYLEWAALADEGELTALENQDLYEPLIKLFERGSGKFNIHHGELIIDNAAFPLQETYKSLLNFLFSSCFIESGLAKATPVCITLRRLDFPTNVSVQTI